ncbi:secreted RxLR effector peptide protein, putative [Phytophthora infestans T30-4]|uniref:RxLR effector protein PITG_16705 n=2 Tax=Phytophthora infestans TaxID=4787 RepID=RXLRW_PHYIT|nr:secreted RxLR effector peptide protein, putative [Phytophthora infestans T30-4]D0NVF3.1 RecName: Full=RxLR effector protein PITG_16705; Flags: Precursor [Phytophthora infestans T30-4]EEY66630.1 secreted RxLR effector peptide protein, putative [Phytophthora infestans T30-4]KAF4131904.1 hypothetical protein GN958_ATG18937 [Phytophthora infestans]|eukprot:XP_002896931.1 secreted RxLR effector peptide protein, putative [Phytophthora infestans T30-4]
MHLFFLTAVAFVITSVSVDASVAKDPRGHAPNRTEVDTVNASSSTRLLRKNSTVDLVGEERAPSIVENIKALVKSSAVTPAKLQQWLDERLPAGLVFKNMNLDEPNIFSLLHEPNFAKWVQYADDLSAKSSHKESSVISTLTSLHGDKVVYDTIQAAKLYPQLSELALKLEKDQIRFWIATRKDPSVVFEALNLNWAGISIFPKPEFSAWLKYVDDVNARHPKEAPLSIIPTLKQRFSRGDEAGTDVLLKLIANGKATTEAKTVANKVESALFDFWLNSRETPDKVMDAFKYGTTTQAFLGSPRWKEWERYLSAYNARYPEKKATAIETLTRKYGDAQLLDTLIGASSKGETKTLAAKLQAQQFDRWMNLKESPLDVYNRLRSSYGDTAFFNEPQLNVWVSYMNVFVDKNPSKVDKMFLELGDTFGDMRLFRVLGEAKKFPNLESTATKLQMEKASTLFASGKSPEGIFKVLALDNVGDDILSNTLFHKWLAYLQKFNKEHPNNQESWFDMLRISYQPFGVERIIETGRKNPLTRLMAEKVENAYHNYWLDIKMEPKTAFRSLHLDESGEKLLADPKFNTWVQYLKTFNDRYPNEKTTVIDGLRDNSHDIALLRMFSAAKNDPSTEKLATDLQSALILKWQDAKKTPEELKRVFVGVPAADEMLDRYIKLLAVASSTP